ncbi:MAG TPA: hypothetical protein VE710_19335 [Candidatus Bathyarchaeia archaeon]|nr:hypothetical protein [Candidatus Bathyarchaeia archaeon]
MFRNSASFFALQGGGDCTLRSESQGSAKVVAATKLKQVAALFPAIHCSAGSGFAGAPFRNMLSYVAVAITKEKKHDKICLSCFFFLSV